MSNDAADAAALATAGGTGDLGNPGGEVRRESAGDDIDVIAEHNLKRLLQGQVRARISSSGASVPEASLPAAGGVLNFSEEENAAMWRVLFGQTYTSSATEAAPSEAAAVAAPGLIYDAGGGLPVSAPPQTAPTGDSEHSEPSDGDATEEWDGDDGKELT